jgi:SAM-dependent methyltransferase
VALNREGWTKSNERYTGPTARASWEQEEITWGQWSKPERELQVLPDVIGRDVVELGCGTAYFGSWLKRAGARRVVGVDVTPAQLETARQLNEEFDRGLELIEANAEDVPLPDDSFDIAFSEYGASIWCDSKLWTAEAARLLRPDGELVFMRGSTLRILCAPDKGKTGDRLQRPQKGMYRLDWEEEEDDWAGVDFHPPMADMLAILRDNGFQLVDFRELYASEDATDHEWYDDPPAAWAKQWPAEEIWRLRLQPR